MDAAIAAALPLIRVAARGQIGREHAMTDHASGYYVPPPSFWPIVGSSALLCLAGGFILFLAKVPAGAWIMALGAALLAVMLFGWFGAVIGENQAGLLSGQADASFRWGMIWFIFSEVM